MALLELLEAAVASAWMRKELAVEELADSHRTQRPSVILLDL